MIPLFLGLAAFNLLCLAITATLGYGVMLHGAALSGLHQLAGVLTTIACCAVHCTVFTYFIATGKWIKQAIQIKHLDPQLAVPTRRFKAKAFPATLAAMMIVFLTAVLGVARLSYGISPLWHQTVALLSIAVNVGVSVVEYQTIAANARLIDSILKNLNDPSPMTSKAPMTNDQ